MRAMGRRARSDNGVHCPSSIFVDDNGHAPPGELIDHGEHAELPPIVCSIHDEVIGPDVIGPARPQTDAGSVVEPQPAPFRLLLWEPLPPPDPLGVHDPEQGSDPPIAISVAGQADDRGREASSSRPRGLLRWVERCNSTGTSRFPIRPGDDQHTAGDGRGLAISSASFKIRRQIRDRLPETPFSFSRSFRRLAWSVRRPPYSLRR